MSIGSLGLIGSVASGQLQQSRGADSDRATQDARNQSREVDSARQAEAAEGVGEMLQDEGASERDADGRRLWERAARRPNAAALSDVIPSRDTPQSVDPTGVAGANLDLTG